MHASVNKNRPVQGFKAWFSNGLAQQRNLPPSRCVWPRFRCSPAHCWTTISPPVGMAAPARRQKS